MSPRRPRIFTLGHSDLSLDAFFGLLEASSIRLIADVRSNPASSRFPHFERHALSSALSSRGLSYRWFRSLGGRAPESHREDEHTAFDDVALRRYAALMNTRGFTETVSDLIGLSASAVSAILCAERDVERCHRRLLSDKLQVMGVRVVHILDEHTAVDHTLHPDLTVDGAKLRYERRQLDLLS